MGGIKTTFEKYLQNKPEEFIYPDDVEQKGVVIGRDLVKMGTTDSTMIDPSDIRSVISTIGSHKHVAYQQIHLLKLLSDFKAKPTAILAYKMGYKKTGNLRQIKKSLNKNLVSFSYVVDQLDFKTASHYQLKKLNP